MIVLHGCSARSPSLTVKAGTMARSNEGTATRCVTPSDTRAATNRRGSVTPSCTDREIYARDEHEAEPRL